MKQFDTDISACISVLENGGTILYPTDTIWGLGCIATNESAVKKIFDIKHRASGKAMIILISDEADLENYVEEVPANLDEQIREWKKPLTIIYPKAKNLPSSLMAEDGSIGIRIVKDEFCNALIKQLGHAIVSTSANISGNDSPKTFAEISDEVKKTVDYVVQYRQQELEEHAASAVIKVTGDGTFEVLRK